MVNREPPGARAARPSASAARALRRLRLRVTAWYIGTFALVLATLGGLLFAALARAVSIEMDTSLRAATREIASAADRREQERAGTGASAIDAIQELRIPEIDLYLFDREGRALLQPIADTMVSALARKASASGSATGSWDAPEDRTLQAYAERFTTRSGTQYVAAAAVNRDAIDDQYSMLLGLAGVLGALGIALVATGGWFLAGKSVEPVERSMIQMRQFMADAAHELRTPVAIIRSRVDVSLEQARDAAAYERTLAELREEAERLATLVDDLFTLARADAEDRAFSPVSVQLDEVVLGAVSTAGWIAARRDIVLTVEDADEALIRGDAQLLRQLVLILLDNAIKFSEPRGVVTIVVRSSADGASLIVEDHGTGIAELDIPRVFDRFYRAESVRGATAGAGLGLAIAKWIADLHGARILIDPVTDGGTRVTVHFPAPQDI
jgi:signal transduction histidine kinase